ncbi:hypothetical protein VP14_135 [Vibrio phage VPMCC14]|nr:hypothetical protein VP14_135 [Vibrio phage VPMCC14]
MKKLIMFVGLLVLTGCEPNSLQKAQMDYICNNRGGVYSYSTMFGKTPFIKVKCVDGQSFDWDSNQQIPEEFYPKKEK